MPLYVAVKPDYTIVTTDYTKKEMVHIFYQTQSTFNHPHSAT